MLRHTIAVIMAASFFPAVVFLQFPHDVIQANVDRLLYNSGLAAAFIATFIVTTALFALLAARLSRPSASAVLKGAVGAAFFLIISDLLRPYLDVPSVPFIAHLGVDLAIAGLIAACLLIFGDAAVRAGAIYASVTIAVVAYSHIEFVGRIKPFQFAQTYATNAQYEPRAGKLATGNVYHLILDAFPAEDFEENANLAAFQGFTFYRYFNSNYPRTAASMPGLLSSRYLRDGDNFRALYEGAPRSGLFPDLTAEGVELSLYPFFPGWCTGQSGRCYALENLMRDGRGDLYRNTQIDFWFLKLLPFSVRHLLNPTGVATGQKFTGVEDTNGFSISRALLKTANPHAERSLASLASIGIIYQLHGLEQFELLLEDEAKRPSTGQYVFWHGMFPHGPRVTDHTCTYVGHRAKVTAADAAKCAAKLAERLIARLKELGKYDDALIIIQSDHGVPPDGNDPEIGVHATRYSLSEVTPVSLTGDYLNVANNQDATVYTPYLIELYSSALLLVKPPRATGPFKTSDVAAQMIDVAPTIADHFGFARTSYEGVALRMLPSMERPSVFFATTRLDAQLPVQAARYELLEGQWRLIRKLELQN